MTEPRTDFDPYIRIVDAFDKNATANSFLAEDGEGGFAAGVYRMAEEIDRLRVRCEPCTSEFDKLRAENERLKTLDKAFELREQAMKKLRARVAELEAAALPTQSELEMMMAETEQHRAGSVTRTQDGSLRTYYAGFNLTALAKYIHQEMNNRCKA